MQSFSRPCCMLRSPSIMTSTLRNVSSLRSLLRRTTQSSRQVSNYNKHIGSKLKLFHSHNLTSFCQQHNRFRTTDRHTTFCYVAGSTTYPTNIICIKLQRPLWWHIQQDKSRKQLRWSCYRCFSGTYTTSPHPCNRTSTYKARWDHTSLSPTKHSTEFRHTNINGSTHNK